MSDLPTIALCFTPRLADLLAADVAFKRHAPKRSVVLSLDSLMLLASLLFLLLELRGNRSASTIAFFGAAVVIFSGELLGRSILFAAVTVLRFHFEPRLHDPFELTASAAGLRYSQRAWQATLEWSYFEWSLETETSFILAYPKNRYSTIPKRAFTSESQIIAFRNLLQAVLPGQAHSGSAA